MKKNLNFKSIENWAKENPLISIVLTLVFILGVFFNTTDYINRTWAFAKEVVEYKEPVIFRVSGDSLVAERLELAKLEATKYKIPSSSISVVKLIGLPMLNHFHKNPFKDDRESTRIPVVSVSPIILSDTKQVFDGGDCRFSIQVSSFDRIKMIASFEVISLSCTDNQEYVYSNDDINSKKSIGYLSTLENPLINSIKVINDEGYLTIDHTKNYLIQLYEPIKNIKKQGFSLFGRF